MPANPAPALPTTYRRVKEPLSLDVIAISALSADNHGTATNVPSCNSPPRRRDTRAELPGARSF
jgi:hypothetical protein